MYIKVKVQKFITFIALGGILVGCSSALPVPLPQQDTAHVEEKTLPSSAEVPMPIAPQKTSVQPQLEHDVAGQIFRHYLSATLFGFERKIGVAGNHYQEALKADPTNTLLMQKAFAVLLAAGKHQEALNIARKMPLEIQNEPLIGMTLIFDEALAGHYDLALEKLKNMRASAPDLIQFQLLENYLEVAHGTPIVDVIQKLDAFDVEPSMAAYKYYHLGRLYLKAGQVDKAVRTLRDGSLIAPQALFIVQTLGDVLSQLGRFDEAIAVYEQFLTLSPSVLVSEELRRVKYKKTEPRKPAYVLAKSYIADDLSKVAYGLASLLLGSEFQETARQFLQLALMVEPEYPMAVFMLGLLEEEKKNYATAIQNYEKILPASSSYLAAQVRIAEVLTHTNKKEEALIAFEKLIKAYPQFKFLHHAVAQFYFEIKKFDLSVKHYELALSGVVDGQQKAALLFAKGAAYERLKNYKKAAQSFQKSLELDPENATVLNYLGYMWLDLGKNLNEAYAYIRQAARLRPHDGAIIDSLGWVYYTQGEYDISIRYLEKAASLLPNDPTIQYHLGKAYYKKGRHKEARVKWERALHLNLEESMHITEIRKLLNGEEMGVKE